MINVEEEVATLHKQLTALYEDSKRQQEKIEWFTQLLCAAFPSETPPWLKAQVSTNPNAWPQTSWPRDVGPAGRIGPA